MVSLAPAPCAPFQNLDFEQYDRNSGFVPGWTFETPGTGGSLKRIVTELPFFDGTTGPNPLLIPPAAAIVPGAWYPGFSNAGNYSLLLAPFGDFAPWYVRQTATIPEDARSLSFDLAAAQVSLTLNGDPVPLTFQYIGNIGQAVGRDFADVSAFTGQSVTLEIKATGITAPPFPGGQTILDNFRFSADRVPIIPEPASLSLVAVCGSLLGLWHWRRRRS